MTNRVYPLSKVVLSNTISDEDSYNNYRLATPITIFESSNIYAKDPTIFDEFTSGTGTSTKNATNSYIDMAVTNVGVGTVVRQSFEYFYNQDGKSKTMLFGGIIESTAGGVANVICRIGCFDSTTHKTTVTGTGNGFFFELNGTTMGVGERLNDVNTIVTKANWNIDRFDGSFSSTNPSGFNITDWSKSYIFVIDLQWVGAGVIKWGLMFNGAIYYCHCSNHSGVGTPSSTAITVPFSKLDKLPVRWEIISSVAVTANMRQMSSTVLIEGGMIDYIQYQYSSLINTTDSVTATIRPIISIKLVATDPGNRATIVIRNISGYAATTTAAAAIRVYKFSNLTAAGLTSNAFVAPNANSRALIDTAATAVNTVNGIVVASGYIAGQGRFSLSFNDYVDGIKINSSIVGDSQVLTVAAVRVGGTNTNVACCLNWIEVI